MSRPIASTAHETPSLMPPLPPAAGAEGSNPIARYDSGFAAPLPRFRVTLPRLTPLLVSPSTRVDRRRRCEERLPRPLSSPGDRPPASQAAAAPATSEYRAPAPATGRKVVYKQGAGAIKRQKRSHRAVAAGLPTLGSSRTVRAITSCWWRSITPAARLLFLAVDPARMLAGSALDLLKRRSPEEATSAAYDQRSHADGSRISDVRPRRTRR